MNYDFGNPYDISQSPSVGDLDQPYSSRLVEVGGVALRESPLDVIRSLSEKSESKTGNIVTSEEAAKIAAENGVQVDVGASGIDSGELDYLISRKKDELYSQTVMANAGSMTVGRMFAELGVGMGVMGFDPTNIALGYIPILNQAKYAAAMNNATRARRFAVRASAGAKEGFVGAAAVEPLVYGGMQELQSDYDETDVALNLFMSTAFGSSMRSIGGHIGDSLLGYKVGDTGLNKSLEELDKDIDDRTKKVLEERGVDKADADEFVNNAAKIREELKRTSPEYRDAIINAAVTQIMTGRKLSIDELVELGLQTDYSVQSFRTQEAADAARLELDNQFEAKIQEIQEKIKNQDDVPLDMLQKLQEFAARMQEEILDIQLAKNEFEIDRALKRGVSLKDIPDLSSIKAKQAMIREALGALEGNERLAADRMELQRLNEMYDQVTPEAVLRTAKDLHNKMRLDKRTNQRAAEWIRSQQGKGAVELAEPEASVKAKEAFEEARIPEAKGEALKEAEAALEAVQEVVNERYGNTDDGVPESVRNDADAIIKEAEEDSVALREAVNCALRGGV